MARNRKHPVQASCRRCNKSLSDPVSVDAGMGYICRHKLKDKDMKDKEPSLFPCEYHWHTDEKESMLFIEDLDSGKTVTNDIKNVLKTIFEELKTDSQRKWKIMYKDTFGVWDGVSAQIIKSDTGKITISETQFYSINETDFNKAKEKLKNKL